LKTRFIAFLRGVNVAGRTVKKDVLTENFHRAGLTNVRTHIASGNVSFDASQRVNRSQLSRKLETLLAGAVGYAIPVFLRSVDEVAALLALEPFEGLRMTAVTRLCVIFISEPLPKSARLPFSSPRQEFELVKATPNEVFATMCLREGRPGNPSAYLEKTYGVKATTRFLGAVEKILAAATGS
jgi:uncharacterized protein (DUF1697 family)